MYGIINALKVVALDEENAEVGVLVLKRQQTMFKICYRCSIYGLRLAKHQDTAVDYRCSLL